MEENNKVIIFEKKEIILVLIFVVVLIITSFTLGIRLGKKLALNESGVMDEDVKTVELKSAAEEDVDKTLSENVFESSSKFLASNNCLVITLNCLVNNPSSSPVFNSGLGERSPSATALVPLSNMINGVAS